MIINTGNRTDIPAFYAPWFYNRIQAGEVLARNPYNETQLIRYRLDPAFVDLIIFTTKNPAPMLRDLHHLDSYRTFWGITITPYGCDIEPLVPPVDSVIESVIELSKRIGKKIIHWRYDPICLTDIYTMDYHKTAFQQMAERLAPYVDACVISFIDLYKKTQRNFPEAREVTLDEQHALTAHLAEISRQNGITLRTCMENPVLSIHGIDTSGCMTQSVLEYAIGEPLHMPTHQHARIGCTCLLGNDIGAYNTCGHLCRYCYANASAKHVDRYRTQHDPTSPLLVGHVQQNDIIYDAKQQSFIRPITELSLF